MDAIKQAFGATPAKFRAAQDKLARDRRVPNGVIEIRGSLMDRFSYAFDLGDEAEKEKIKEEIREFNKKHRNATIQGDNLIQSLKTRARGSAIAAQLGGNVAQRRFIRELENSRREYYDPL